MSAALTLAFTRVSPTHHRFEYRREDGTGKALEMETCSLLFHDLLHFAVESEARLKGSFYGILGRIGGYEELIVAGGAALGGEIAITERVVGALTGAWRDGTFGDEAFVAEVSDTLDLYEERAPRWFTPAFIVATRERMRQLMARWNASELGETMELEFPCPAAEKVSAAPTDAGCLRVPPGAVASTHKMSGVRCSEPRSALSGR